MKRIFELLKTITLRDFLLVFGLGLFGLGLYLFLPALSFAVCGAIIFTLAFIFGGK
jgi:hypothetical protein